MREFGPRVYLQGCPKWCQRADRHNQQELYLCYRDQSPVLQLSIKYVRADRDQILVLRKRCYTPAETGRGGGLLRDMVAWVSFSDT